jgi:hypothetical protein
VPAPDFRVAYREATPTSTIRKVQAHFALVQSIISMTPIYCRAGKRRFAIQYSVSSNTLAAEI